MKHAIPTDHKVRIQQLSSFSHGLIGLFLIRLGLIGLSLIRLDLVGLILIRLILIGLGLIELGLVELGLVELGLVELGLIELGLIGLGLGPSDSVLSDSVFHKLSTLGFRLLTSNSSAWSDAPGI